MNGHSELSSPNQQRLTTLHIESLYECYWSKVYQKCLSITKNPDQAQDYTQDIFLILFDKISTFQGKAHITTWLYTITCNYCFDRLKQSRRVSMEPLTDNFVENVSESSGNSFDEQLAWRLYEQLPPTEKQLLALKYQQQLSLKELSEELNVSVAALKMRLLRSRQQLRLAYQVQLDW